MLVHLERKPLYGRRDGESYGGHGGQVVTHKDNLQFAYQRKGILEVWSCEAVD